MVLSNDLLQDTTHPTGLCILVATYILENSVSPLYLPESFWTLGENQSPLGKKTQLQFQHLADTLILINLQLQANTIFCD